LQEFIDLGKFKEVCHDDAQLAITLISQMKTALNEQLKELRESTLNNDLAECKAIAHRILGVARYLCCMELEEIATEVETGEQVSKKQLERLYEQAQNTLHFLHSQITDDKVTKLFS